MALKMLLLAKKLKDLRAAGEAFQATKAEIEGKRKTWKEREERATAMLDEITAETPQEERDAFDAECSEIEAEDAAIQAEEEANAKAIMENENAATAVQTEIDELNERSKEGAKNAAAAKEPEREPERKERKGVKYMETREEMRARQLHEICQADEVRTVMANVRAYCQRGVTNATLTVPTVMVPMVRESIERYSKLMKHVNKVTLPGEGKVTMLGKIPEAVWTENAGKLNELSLKLAQVKVDVNKVGGYIPVPNPFLQDSDENLAGIIVDYLGQSIGYGLDKAVIYGTGTDMPVGIIPRLTFAYNASTAPKPSWWQANMPDYTDLSTSNVGKASAASVTGAALFKEIIKTLGKIKAQYVGGSGNKFWAMSPATWLTLQAEMLSINSAGAIVTGAQAEMPIIGGAVEILDFIPDNNIIGGYGQAYLLAERRGIELMSSEHARFTDDVTVFRGKARYDGIPVAGEAFAAFSISTTAVATSPVTAFATDSAN